MYSSTRACYWFKIIIDFTALYSHTNFATMLLPIAFGMHGRLDN